LLATLLGAFCVAADEDLAAALRTVVLRLGRAFSLGTDGSTLAAGCRVARPDDGGIKGTSTAARRDVGFGRREDDGLDAGRAAAGVRVTATDATAGCSLVTTSVRERTARGGATDPKAICVAAVRNRATSTPHCESAR
jgi:hypothetical protein